MSHPILEFCNREHAQLQNFYNEYLEHKTDDSSVALRYFTQFKCGVHRHMSIEEDVFFKFFEEKTGLTHIGPTFRMRKEHQHIRDILSQIQSKIVDGNPRTANEEVRIVDTFWKHGVAEDELLMQIVEVVANEEEVDQLLKKLESYPKGCCLKCINQKEDQ